jgi:hypothetical protein
MCPPEIVIFDSLTKTTLLLPAAEARLYACFDNDKTQSFTEEQLKEATSFFSEQTDSYTIFYDSLSSLVQLNLIEPIK